MMLWYIYFLGGIQMRVAVIGSRTLTVPNLADYLPADTTELISGGAKGVDTSARNYALANHLPLTELRPNYRRYRKGAPLKRTIDIIQQADFVLIFWDGASKGTRYAIEQCKKLAVAYRVYRKDAASTE